MRRAFLFAAILSIAFLPPGSRADPLSLDGVAGFVEGRARGAIRATISRDGSEWLCDAFAEAFNRSRSGGRAFGLAELFRQDPALKSAVQAELKARIKEWLPDATRDLIQRDLLGAALGKEGAGEAAKIAERVAQEMDTSLNDQLDAIASGIYDSAVERVKREMAERGVSNFVDPADLKGSIRRAFEPGNIADLAAANLARLVGENAVRGIRGRMEDVLSGTLPPEAVEALRRGPEEFDRFVRDAGRYMPGNALESFRDSILNRPVIELPTAAYASMLAAAAAGHYARAYDGVFVDPYELKRAAEVTRVMAWQLENKRSISLTVVQLGSIARDVAGAMGMGVSFDAALGKIRAPLERVQAAADRIDSLLEGPLGAAQAELHALARQMEGELRSLQGMLTAPAREALAKIERALREAGDAAAGLVPDSLDGLPEDFEELKGRLGLPDGLLGELGDKSPREIARPALERIREDLAELNDRASGLISQGAAGALGVAHLLGPAAAIIGAERIPAQGVSDGGSLDPVLLHSGEYVQEVTEMVIPGRGLDFRFTRIYRGLSDFRGELGWRWTHSFAERLLHWNDGGSEGFTHVDGRGRKYFYRRAADGFESPAGAASRLDAIGGNRHALTAQDGLRTDFDAQGRPKRKCDRHGNCLEYEYGDDGLLSSVIDPYGRRVSFKRTEGGLISAIEDFAGRSVRFEYNGHGELTGVRSPSAHGFPRGKLTAYRYETPPGAAARSHRITMVMDPSGRVYLRNRYDAEGRVTAQRLGDGPWMLVKYAEGSGNVASRAWVTDAEGRVTLCEHDAEGRLIRRWAWDGSSYRILEYSGYDAAGMPSYSCTPSGRCLQRAYDRRGLVVMEMDRPAGGGEPRITKIRREKWFGRPSFVSLPSGEQIRTVYSETPPHDPVAVFGRRSPSDEWERIAAHSFDARGLLVEETDTRGVVTAYEYYSERDPDGDGAGVADDGAPLVAPDDGSGGGYLKAIVVDARDADGRRASGPPLRERRSFAYDPVGNVTAVEGAQGVVRFVVNQLNEIVKEERKGRWPIYYNYDANDNMSSVEIKRPGAPIVHRIAHDSLDRISEIDLQSSPDKRLVTRYSYDPAGRPVSVAGPGGDIVRYERDREGRVLCIVAAAGSADESRDCVSRDADGEIVSHADGSGVVTRFERNGFGEAIAEVDALGNRTEYASDPSGRVVGVVRRDAAGELMAEERLEYAGEAIVALEQRLWRDDPSRSRWLRTEYSQDPSGMIAGVRDPLGNFTSYAYDGAGRLAETMRPDGSVESLSRDSAGRIVGRSVLRDGALFGTVEQGFDEAGGIAWRREGTAERTEFERDGMGLVTWMKEPSGVMTRYEHDDLGRPLSATREGGGISARMKMEWDAGGRLAAIVDPNGARSAFGYDSLGRLVLERFADGSERRTRYDRAGRVADLQRQSGVTLSMEYDARGMLVARRGGEGDSAASQIFRRDGMGRVVEAVDGNSPGAWDDESTIFVYDSLSRPVAESQGGEWISRSFDDAGRRVAVSLPGGNSVYYAYGADGLVSSVMGGRGAIASIRRDPLGNIVRAEMEDGISLESERDPWGRELSRRYLQRGAEIASWRYVRDGAGRIVSADDSLLGKSLRYERDGFGRLASVFESAAGGEEAKSSGYEYDAAGNMVLSREGGAARRIEYDEMNRPLRAAGSDGATIEIAHDADGNLTKDGARSYAYDPFGRLAEAVTEHGLAHRRRYDAFDRLVRMGGEGDAYGRFVWDGWDLASFVPAEGPRVEFAHAGTLLSPLAYLDGGRPSYMISDGGGSVRAVQGDEGFGQRCDFDPYGGPATGEGCWNRKHPFGFAGQLSDLLDGLVYMRYRHYAPAFARFVSPDPLGFKLPFFADSAFVFGPAISYHRGQGQASRASIPDRPLSIFGAYNAYPFDRIGVGDGTPPAHGEPNLYIYAGADPISNWDPWGLASLFFDRGQQSLMLFEGDGYLLTSYVAANNTVRPGADPMLVGGFGPAPQGVLSVGIPEFYSERYRAEFYRRFGLGEAIVGESAVTGGGWAGVQRPGYNVSQGLIRFRVGSPGSGADGVAWRRGIFIHGGRDNRHTARTFGCIRARDDELETLAANFIALRRQGDAVDSLYVE